MSELTSLHHFSFTEPLYLLLLVLVPLLFVFARLIRSRRSRYAVAFTNLGVFARVRSRRRTPWRRRVGITLLALSLAAAAGALARPHVQMTTEDHSATIILLVDISGSMDAADVQPSRMDAAVAAMHQFLDKLPKSDKVGLVTFSDKVQVRNVPTTDRAAISGALDTLNPETGTALGDGVEAAVKLAVQTLALDGVRPRPGKYVPAAIVLESDGAQNRGKLTPAEAGTVAKNAGVKIFGVALGTRYGQVTEGSGILRSIPVPPDPGTVRLLARLSGGEAFNAETAASLNSTYRHLGTSVGKHRESRDVTAWFELAAALLLVGGVVAERAWRSSLP